MRCRTADMEGEHVERYEAPTLTEVGSIREMTLGGTNLQDWSDEIRLWKIVIPLPGEFS